MPVLESTPEIEALRINELQIIASHNSYKRFPVPAIFNFAMAITGFLPPNINASNWDYDHLPLPEQLGIYGVRGFELDIYNDPVEESFTTGEATCWWACLGSPIYPT